jgi:hypothetical protein
MTLIPGLSLSPRAYSPPISVINSGVCLDVIGAAFLRIAYPVTFPKPLKSPQVYGPCCIVLRRCGFSRCLASPQDHKTHQRSRLSHGAGILLMSMPSPIAVVLHALASVTRS